MTLWRSIHPKIKNPPRETDKSKKTLFPTPPLLELRLKHEGILSVVSVGKWSGNVYRRTVVAGSEIMKMLGREANRRPQKQVASSLEIQIWSAVNCHSRGWTVIHRLCPPQRPVNRGGGGEGGEPPRTVRFPEARYWITIVNEEIRGQPASRRRSKPRWKFMECRSPLFLCPPPSPWYKRYHTFEQGEFQPGRIDEAREKRTPFLFSQFVRLALVSRRVETRRHCANSPRLAPSAIIKIGLDVVI